MAYLKYYYPREFITVSLETNNGAQEKVNGYVEEARTLNQKVIQPSILHSLETISIYDGSILFGFNFIKGIGTSVSSKIIDIRSKYSFKTFSQAISLLLKNGLGKATIETLIKAGCFDELLDGKTRFYLINNIDNILIGSKYLKEDGEFIIEPTLNDATPTSEQLQELKNFQFELLGIDFSPIEENAQSSALRKEKNAVTLVFASSNEGKHKVIGTINTIKTLNTKYGAQMAFVNISDETKAIKLTL
jgi:DNA polymerase-3 subunit alpha